MTSITADDRVRAVRYLHTQDEVALRLSLEDLTEAVSILQSRKNVSALDGVQATLNEVRRRMTRVEAFEEVLR